MKLGAAVVLVLSACTAPRIEGSGACVEVDPPYEERVSEIVRSLEPRIIELLGTRWPWKYRVALEREDEDSVAETREWDRRITLGPLSLSDEGLPLALAHELAHVHMRAPWTDLPRVLQEGVATWVSLLVLDRTNEFGGPIPDWQVCFEVLTLPYSEFLDADRERENELRYAATWMVAMFMSGAQPPPVPATPLPRAGPDGGPVRGPSRWYPGLSPPIATGAKPKKAEPE